jgi:hypothetical protein
MMQGMRPGIILLREGTDTSQVRDDAVFLERGANTLRPSFVLL